MTSMRTVVGVVSLVLCASLTACGSSDGEGNTGPTAACLASLKAADDLPIDVNANAAIAESLSACQTADEWLSALRVHPGAMGMADPTKIGSLDLQVACNKNMSTPVCEDAAARDLLNP